MTPARAVVWPSMMALALAAAAQAAAAQRGGVRLELGAFAVQPILDDRSGEVFERIGKFRAGPGTSLAVGYDRRRFGATVALDLAGLDIGPPRTRDGIGMGRESGIFRSAGFLGHWSPNRRIGTWQPLLTVGYVRQGLDNVLVPPDSLPEFARDLRRDPADVTARPAGITGSGVRLAGALERNAAWMELPGTVTLSVELSGDITTFTTVTYDGRERRLPDAGTGIIPRLAVTLRWSPRTRAATPGMAGQQQRAERE